jgi:hypothetical protein
MLPLSGRLEVITEKDMEKAIIRDPARYIGAHGLRLIARNDVIKGCFFNLRFEDRMGDQLAVALQRGTLDRALLSRVLEYSDKLRLSTERFLQPMVIAMRLTQEQKQRLSSAGVIFREIPEGEFVAHTESDKPPIDRIAIPGDNKTAATNPVPAQSPATTGPTLAVRSLCTAGLSAAQIVAFNKAVQQFEIVILPKKQKREAEAERILQQHRGTYTIDILEEVFDLIDKGPIGPVTGDWFGEMLSEPNRKMIRNCPIGQLRYLIDTLRKTGDLGYLSEWRRASTCNRGIKTGVATLFMYLRAPERYNIWLPKTHSGLSGLCRMSANFPKGVASSDTYRTLYNEFNEKAIALRQFKKVAPQTMDWYLFAIDEFRTDSVDGGLQALIDGRIA